MTLLDIKDVSYYYQDGDYRRYVLEKINYSFKAGVFYTILGQSGSGKTTLLSLISAMDSLQSGEIDYKGQSYAKIGLNNLRRNYLGMIFQSYNLIPYMTALENVLVAMSITENKIPDNSKEVAYNLLDFIGITKSKADRKINRLSGGEQQRVAIARALATNVDLILADEPTGNLDDKTEAEIIDIFKDLAHNHNKCVIVVTHSAEIAAKSDVILRLRKGTLTEDE